MARGARAGVVKVRFVQKSAGLGHWPKSKRLALLRDELGGILRRPSCLLRRLCCLPRLRHSRRRATEGIKNALRAGYDTIEHGSFIDDEGLDLLLERDVPCVPGLYFEKASVERGPEFGLPQAVIDGHQETLEAGAASALKILRAGGRLGLGGDYGFAWTPHGTYAHELTFFVEDVGFTPMEALTCATKTGAEIMSRGDELGTLEPGKLADVLVVVGDVTADISILEDRNKFIAVLQGGKIKAGQLAPRHEPQIPAVG